MNHAKSNTRSDEMNLTEFEALVLTGVIAAGTDAYAVPIFEEIERLLPAKEELSLGKMYVTLDHLEQHGFVRSWYSTPEEEPNGRSRRYFEITGAGSRVLKEALAPGPPIAAPELTPRTEQP